MTERSQRRAAERKSRKLELKKLRNQPPLSLAAGESLAHLSGQAPSIQTIAGLIAATNEVIDKASAAQLAANRLNALRSTGPQTELGKSIAAQNNFRHGLTQTEATFKLLASESKEDYTELLAGYQSEWQPATPTENTLVNRLANHEWLRIRALNLQSQFLDQQTGLIADERNFNLYRRYEVQHERAFNKALSDLLRLRATRIREQNGFESQARKNEKHEYQMRHLQHRETLHRFNEMTAQCRMTLAQSKLIGVKLEDGPALRCTCEPGTPGCCPEEIR